MLTVNRPMFSKLIPLRRSRTEKEPEKKPMPPSSFLSRWRRHSTPVHPQGSPNNTIINRSQLIGPSVPASEALNKAKKRKSLSNLDIQSFVPKANESSFPKSNFLTPEYMLDVNLRLTNTNNTGRTSVTWVSEVSA